MDIMKIANSLPMWIACGLAVCLVIAQAIIFAKHSYATGKKMGLTTTQMKRAMKSSAITSIGPSVVILSGLLSLLVSVGGPMAWMRLSFIGSVMFETMAAGFGTSAVGVALGSDPMTEVAFACAVWTMILGSLGWIIFATFFADKMGKIQQKVSKGDSGLLSAISTAAIIGAFAALSSSHLVKLNKNTVACIAGGIIMLILGTIAEKRKIKWLREWALTLALLGGMLVTLIF